MRTPDTSAEKLAEISSLDNLNGNLPIKPRITILPILTVIAALTADERRLTIHRNRPGDRGFDLR
jgi:hypothetical protein